MEVQVGGIDKHRICNNHLAKHIEAKPRVREICASAATTNTSVVLGGGDQVVRHDAVGNLKTGGAACIVPPACLDTHASWFVEDIVGDFDFSHRQIESVQDDLAIAAWVAVRERVAVDIPASRPTHVSCGLGSEQVHSPTVRKIGEDVSRHGGVFAERVYRMVQVEAPARQLARVVEAGRAGTARAERGSPD